uniref:Uncharacterized protein n=1 Tax=Populus davidiana TaxID=266767 RepID=A0A6M2EFY2_9ROSI
MFCIWIQSLVISSLSFSRRNIQNLKEREMIFLALCGFKFALTHLDGRQLLIKSNPGEVVKPDSFKAINDEGMPMYQRPFMKGKLYTHFTVDFPDSLTPDQVKAMGTILLRPSSQLTDMELGECEETTLHDVNME